MKQLPMLIIALGSIIAISACSKEEMIEGEGKAPPAAHKEASKEAKAAEPIKPELDPACPSATTVTAMTFKAPGAEALAIAPEKFAFAKARLAKEGKLEIFVSTQDWSIDKLGVKDSPIDSAEDAILNINILSKELAAGSDYLETGDLETQLGVDLHTKGLASGAMIAKPSHVKLLAYSDDSVCGEFAIQGMFDGDKTKFVGSFVAPLVKK